MRPSICYVAPYDPDYSRNADVIRALRDAGARVEVVRGPEGSLFGPGRTGVKLAGLALRSLASSAARWLEIPLRLLRCRVLVIGYFGQLDMLVLAPMTGAMGLPVIFNPLVTLSDTLVADRKMIAPGSLPAEVIRRIDRWALRRADIILADTNENAEYMAELSGLPLSRFLVLPVGVDEDVFYPRRRSDLRVSGELDVLFYGTFIPLHGIETIIRAAAELQKCDVDARIELIGTGQEYGSARELAERIGATNIRWRDWLPYSELGNRLREADVALGIFDDGPKASRVIPNKVHQALASGVPIVTRESPAISRLLRDGESAMLVPPADHSSLADAILQLAGDERLRARIGEEGRRVWEAEVSAGRLSQIAAIALDRAGGRL